MFFAAAAVLLAMYADWVPARWMTGDPASLELLDNSPINCLLLEREHWNKEFVAAAAGRGIATLGVIRPGMSEFQEAGLAKNFGMAGAVMEGSFDPSAVDLVRRTLGMVKRPLIEITDRSSLNFASSSPILATTQGVWAGLHIDEKTGIPAGPTSAPWIDTNTGFLRYARAASPSIVWLGNLPPERRINPVRRYLQMIGDAWSNGGRWIIALDSDLAKRLLARDEKALADWKQINDNIRHYETHPEWRGLETRSKLAIVEDPSSGALINGGLADMIAVKHIPVRPLPADKVAESDLKDVQILVSLNPELPADDKLAFKSVSGRGGAVIEAPADWKMASARPGAYMLDSADAGGIDSLYRRISVLANRQNMSVRLFNVSSMLSNVLDTKGQRQVVVHLVNHSDYPTQNISVQIVGDFQRARLFRPEGPPADLDTYRMKDGTGIDIEQRIITAATLVLE